MKCVPGTSFVTRSSRGCQASEPAGGLPGGQAEVRGRVITDQCAASLSLSITALPQQTLSQGPFFLKTQPHIRKPSAEP